MPDVTNPVAPGNQTSEGKLTTYIHIAVAFLFTAEAVTGVLMRQFPNVTWISAIAMGLTALTGIMAKLGYDKSRTAVKVAMIENGPPGAPSNPP